MFMLNYMNYIAQFGKTMNSVDEFDARLELYTATDLDIKKINSEQSDWVAGHNQFSDWTHEEYKKILGYKEGATAEPIEIKHFDESSNSDTVNWNEKGAVTPVKDQG